MTNLEILETLVGKKATIFKYSEFGFAHSIECEILKVYKKDYAQYNDLIHVEYKPKRKRCTYVWRLHDYATFAVFAGHVALNTDMFVNSKETNGLVMRESLLSFSDGYLDIALASTIQNPLLVQREKTENYS
jgi:hypothetical protein